MIITDILEVEHKKYLSKVFINNEPSFILYTKELKRLGIIKGMEIEPEKVSYINKTVIFNRAKKKALSLILKKQNSQNELKNKLLNYGYSEAICSSVISYLNELNYLNDREFARKYINDAIKLKKYGINKIKYELLKKGIEDCIIEDYLNDFLSLEDENLKKMIFLKLEKTNDFSKKNLDKIRAHFYRKGFLLSNINCIINEYLKNIESGV